LAEGQGFGITILALL